MPILFFNMGSRHLEVCVISYKFVKPAMADEVNVKGCAASKDIGGHFFDLVIAGKMLELPRFAIFEFWEMLENFEHTFDFWEVLVN